MLGSSMQRMLSYGLTRRSHKPAPRVSLDEAKQNLAQSRVELTVIRLERGLFEERIYGRIPQHPNDYPERMWP